MVSWLKQARLDSGLSLEDCASALRCSRHTYESREKKPGTLSIDELRILMPIFSSKGKGVASNGIKEAVGLIF